LHTAGKKLIICTDSQAQDKEGQLNNLIDTALEHADEDKIKLTDRWRSMILFPSAFREFKAAHLKSSANSGKSTYADTTSSAGSTTQIKIPP